MKNKQQSPQDTHTKPFLPRVLTVESGKRHTPLKYPQESRVKECKRIADTNSMKGSDTDSKRRLQQREVYPNLFIYIIYLLQSFIYFTLTEGLHCVQLLSLEIMINK